jgi:hypothetical protein
VNPVPRTHGVRSGLRSRCRQPPLTHVPVVWPSRLAHRVVRRLRRPPRGLRGRARSGLPFGTRRTASPRCVTSGTRAGARRKVDPHRCACLSAGLADLVRLPSSLGSSVLLGPLSRVTPAASGSRSRRHRSDPSDSRRPGSSFAGAVVLDGPCSGKRRSPRASAGRCHPPRSFRPRGSSTSTACSAAGLQHVAAGTGCGVREVGSGSSVGAPLAFAVGAPRAGPGRPLARPLRRFESRSVGRRASLRAVPLVPFLPRGRPDRSVRPGRPDATPIARCRRRAILRSPGGPRFRPHRPTRHRNDRRPMGGACSPVRVPSSVCSARGARSGGSAVASELAARPSEIWRVPRSPVARCAKVARIGWVDLSSFHVRSRRPRGLRSLPWGVGMWPPARRVARATARRRAPLLPLPPSRGAGCAGVASRPTMSRGRDRPPRTWVRSVERPRGTFADRRRGALVCSMDSRARGRRFERRPRDLRSVTTRDAASAAPPAGSRV